MSVVAVIPARGGSKRIPRKNIRLFLGKPVITYPIEAALASGLFDRVVVSTDDAEIAAVALASGAEVPFTRPTELADDMTATLPVIRHAIAALGGDASIQYACCIYPTAPFVTAADLRAAFEVLKGGGHDYVFSATSFDFPVYRGLRLLPGGRVTPLFPQLIESRSQDLDVVIHDAGQFYWGRADAFLRGEPIFGGGAVATLLPRMRVQDIDTEEDWERAEALYRLMQMGGLR